LERSGQTAATFIYRDDRPEMFLRLFLLFTCIPLVELYLLLKIGSVIGAVNTILLVIITGVLGAYLAQQEGLRTLDRIRALMAQGEMPGEPLIDALLILVAGFVLITPGILTDLLGFLLLIPGTRAPIRGWIRGRLERKFASGNAAVYTIDPDER
jgi:UPF0716 protein FxsA